MSDKVEVPLQLPAEVEADVRKMAEHTGYTRDEVIEKILAMTFDMADAWSERLEMPSFLVTIKKALKEPPRELSS
jgi:hypothetical protein